MWWNLFVLWFAVLSSVTTQTSPTPVRATDRVGGRGGGGGGGGGGQANPYLDPHCGSRQVIVQLFEWTWADVGRECQDYLGPHQFCGVQVSPLNEHVVLDSPPAPWWQRYEPVSYKLTSRSGTEQDFADMVLKCNAVGVRIYVDVVFNNMAEIGRWGEGSAGSSYDGDFKEFPGVSYGARDFNDPKKCPSATTFVTDYTNADEIRNCSFDGLTDLDQSAEHVRQKVTEYLNHLIDLGVSGFRVDSAKFMWPSDLEAIEHRLHDLPGGGRPFMILEVEDYDNDAISGTEYTHLGYVTDYGYGRSLAQLLTTSQDLNDLRHFRDHGALPSDHALVFVDNHETQRMPQEGRLQLSHKEPKLYTMATAFTLAQDYGFVRVMSSYRFTDLHSGPPSNATDHYRTKNVPISNGTCGDGWVCEHRWPAISAMVRFRNAVSGTDVNHWTSQANFLAFSRGDVGFFAMTSADAYQGDVMTNLPPGRYCELVSQCREVVTVDEQGMVHVDLNGTESPFLAILTDWPASDVLPYSSQFPTVTVSSPPVLEEATLLPSGLTLSMDQTPYLYTSTRESTMPLEPSSDGQNPASEISGSSLAFLEPSVYVNSTYQNSGMIDSVPYSSTVIESTSRTFSTTSSYFSTMHASLMSSEYTSLGMASSGLTLSSSFLSTAIPMLASSTELLASSVLPAVSESVDAISMVMSATQPSVIATSVTLPVTSAIYDIKPTMTFAAPSISPSSTNLPTIATTSTLTTATATTLTTTTTTATTTTTTAITTPTTLTTTTTPVPTTTESPFKRTIILLERPTTPGEYIFFRGGIDEKHRPGCSEVASDSNPCTIPIRYHEEDQSGHYTAFNVWRQGDHFLDWHGHEPDQQRFQGQEAQGSPGIWTTDHFGGHGHTSLNIYGEHYWMLDVEMDCSKTENGYFEFKAFSTKSGWVSLPGSQPACSGSRSYPYPGYTSDNHFGRCGYLNVYNMDGACQINNL